MFKDRVPSGESYLEDFITKKCKIFEFSKINKIMSLLVMSLLIMSIIRGNDLI